MKKVAVILCGSGFKDGSEIRESVGVLWALSALKAQVEIFAPDAPQVDVVNCLTLQPVPGERRNMLIEAARIARGQIKDVKELRSADFSALVIPGGFGVAKNLCTFASQGSQGEVRPEIKALIKDFHKSGKAIGAICIAPALVALALKGEGLELTLGAAGEAAQEIEKLGHKHFVTKANECHVDKKHKIVTSPAYMHDSAPLDEIFDGIRKAMTAVLGF